MRDFRKDQILETIKLHSKFTKEIEKKVKETPAVVLENKVSPFARKIYTFTKDVYREFERARQFARTRIIAEKFFCGVFVAKHNIAGMILDFFHKRFPAYTLCLYNKKRKQTFIMNRDGNSSVFEGGLEKALLSMDVKPGHFKKGFGQHNSIEESIKEMYDAFYESQYIKDRKNPRYYRQMIPKSVKEDYELDIEKRIGNQQLDKYLK